MCPQVKEFIAVDFELSTEMKCMNLSLIHEIKANIFWTEHYIRTMHIASNAFYVTTDSNKMAKWLKFKIAVPIGMIYKNTIKICALPQGDWTKIIVGPRFSSL